MTTGRVPAPAGVNFNYFISEPVFEYILQAVALVAREGWRMLGEYRFDPARGLWVHRHGSVSHRYGWVRSATALTGRCSTPGTSTPHRSQLWRDTCVLEVVRVVARISSAVLVQTNGLGFSFQVLIQLRMSASRAWTLVARRAGAAWW